MRFRLGQQSVLAHRAEQAIIPAILIGGGLYLVLDRVFSRVLGGYWGGLAAIVLAATPVAALIRVAFSARTPRQAFCEGVCVGLAVAGVYAWVFTAPFVSPPGF